MENNDFRAFGDRFKNPPKCIRSWLIFASLFTVFAVFMAPDTDMNLLRLLQPAICWIAIPSTLLNNETHTWQYYKNMAMFDFAVAFAAGITIGIWSFSQEQPMAPETVSHFIKMAASAGILLLANLMIALIEKYKENRRNRYGEP